MSAGFRRGRVSAFGGAKKPEEGDDAEISAVLVEGPEGGVIKVQGGAGAGDDSRIGWVGAGRRAVLVAEGFEESSE